MYEILMDPRPPPGRPHTHRRRSPQSTPRAVKSGPPPQYTQPAPAGLNWAFGANRVTSRGIRFQRPARETRLSGRVPTADSNLKNKWYAEKKTTQPSAILHTPCKTATDHENGIASALADALAEAARCRVEVAHALTDCEERLLQLFKVDDVRKQAKTILVCAHASCHITQLALNCRS